MKAPLHFLGVRHTCAPVAQGIEHRPPEAGAQVRILPGARKISPGGTHVMPFSPNQAGRDKSLCHREIFWPISLLIHTGAGRIGLSDHIS